MAECIKHPANLWLDTELLVEETMTHVHVEDQVLIVWTCLIRGRPATLSYLELTFLNKVFNAHLIFLAQQLIPHVKILHFDVRERSLWISLELVNECIQDVLHSRPFIVDDIGPKEILFVRLSPSNIVVRVRYQMDCKLFRLLLSFI